LPPPPCREEIFGLIEAEIPTNEDGLLVQIDFDNISNPSTVATTDDYAFNGVTQTSNPVLGATPTGLNFHFSGFKVQSWRNQNNFSDGVSVQ
jgi:hypothetical protein